MFGITFVYLILGFGPFSPADVNASEKLSSPLYAVIKEASYRNIERPETFGIEPKTPSVTPNDWNEQRTPNFAGVVSNFTIPTGADMATRQKLKLGGITKEEMLYL